MWRLPFVETGESAERLKEMQHKLHALRSIYFSGILTELVNNNIFYIQNNIGANVTFLHRSVALAILGLLSGFPRLYYDTPYWVGSLSSRDRLVPEIST
jgi:hypothetical protein